MGGLGCLLMPCQPSESLRTIGRQPAVQPPTSEARPRRPGSDRAPKGRYEAWDPRSHMPGMAIRILWGKLLACGHTQDPVCALVTVGMPTSRR